MSFNTTFAKILNLKGDGHILIPGSVLIKQFPDNDVPSIRRRQH